MGVSNEVQGFGYDVGEEVVVNLHGVEAFDVDRGTPVPEECMPSWTIGGIVARVERPRRPYYLVKFEHHDVRCLVIAGEGSIEGTA